MEIKPVSKNWSEHKFVLPKKAIITPEDIEIFKKTKTFHNFMTFIQELQKSVESKSYSETGLSPKFQDLINLLETLELLIEEVPPLQQKMRFGNLAFRTWHERVQTVIILFLMKT